MLLYSITFYVLFDIVGAHSFGLKSSIKALFPITYNTWWFASTYFVLYLLHPFINILLQNLDKKTYCALIVMQLILWCIIPTFTMSSYQSNYLVWFITLYSVAGYIRLFGLNPRFNLRHYIGFSVLFLSLRYLTYIIFTVLGTKFSFFAANNMYFYNPQSVLTLLGALSIFMVFEKCKTRYVRWINIAASATFGVYLIHDSRSVREFLWLDVFKNAQYANSPVLIPYSILVVAIVYTVCTLIDLARQHFIEKPFMWFADRSFEKLTKPFAVVINYIGNIAFGKEDRRQ